MASTKELRALITLAGKVDPSLQNAMMKASKQSMKVSNDVKKSAATMSKTSSIVKGVVIGNLASNGIQKLGEEFLEAGKNGVKLASDLQEVQNVVDVTFTSNAKQINVWSQKAINSFGLSELQAKQYTGTLGAMMKSSGLAGDKIVKMSENLTGLSGDFSSFYNISQQDAFEKIRSGISGETEPLKQLGINMSVANLEAYALSKGITTSYQKMDQAAQTALRYSYLMDVSKDAQGDFARTQGGFANQTRLLKVNFEQLSAKIMSNALPALTKLVQAGNNFMSNIDSNKIVNLGKTGFKYLGDTIKWVKDNMDWLMPVAAGVLGAFVAFSIITQYITWLNGATLATKLFTVASNFLKTSLLSNPIFWVALAIGALVTVLLIAYKHSEKFRNAVNGLLSKIAQFGTNILNIIVPALKSMYEWFQANILPILQRVGNYFMANILPILIQVGSTVMSVLGVAFNTLVQILKNLWNSVLVPLFNFFSSTILPIITFVGGIVLWLWQTVLAPLASFIISVFKGAFEVAIPYIGDVISTYFSLIGGIINGATQVFSGLIDFITGIFTGNWEKAWQGVKSILSGIWSGLGAILKAPINLAIDAVNALIKGFNKVASVDVPIVGKIGVTIPEIPKFALGGIATQASIFGEAGPEMAIPLKRTPRSLGLLNQTARILGAKGEKTTNKQPIYLTYSPVYYGANKEEISLEFEKHKGAIIDIIEDYLSDKERLAYGE